MKSQYYLAVESITYAMKGARILAQNGVRVQIVRTPRGILQKGCGYSLMIYESPDHARAILTTHGIRVLQIAEGKAADTLQFKRR